MANVFIPPWLEPQPIPQLYAQGMNTGIAAAAQQNEARQAAARLAQQYAAMQQQAIANRAELDLNRQIADQKAAQAAIDSQIDAQRNSAMAMLREQEIMNKAAVEAEKLANAERMLAYREEQARNLDEIRRNQFELSQRLAERKLSEPISPERLPEADRIQLTSLVNTRNNLLADPTSLAMAQSVNTNVLSDLDTQITNILQRIQSSQFNTVPGQIQPTGTTRLRWDMNLGKAVQY